MSASILTIGNKKYAVIPLKEYEKLRGDETPGPALPEPGPRGNRSAVATADTLIARQIIRKRIALNLSQKELADKAGIAVETLSRIESGKRRPQMATLERLCKALGQ